MTESTRAEGCDYPGSAPLYAADFVDGDPVYACRCMVCARCNHHTGNSNQGHYWAYCKVTKQMEDFHFCCPGNCELEPTRQAKAEVKAQAAAARTARRKAKKAARKVADGVS